MNIKTLFEFSFDKSSPQATQSNAVQGQTTLGDLNFEVFECLYSASVYSIAAKTQHPEIWGSVYNSGGTAQGRIRVGREIQSTSDTPISWGEWSTVRLKRIWTQVEGAFVSVKITAVDEMLYLKNRVPRNMYKQKTVNDIITQILDEHKIENSEVDKFSSTEYTLCQCGMTDFEFISEVLLPRASKKPVHFYTRNGNVICIKERKYSSPVASFSYEETSVSDTKVPLGPVITSMDVNTSNFGVLGVTFDTQKSQKEPFLVENLIADSVEDYMDPLVKRQPVSLAINKFPGAIKNFVVETLAADVVDELKTRVVPEFSQTMHRLAIFSYTLPLLKLGDIITVSPGTLEAFKLAGGGTYMVYALYHYMFYDRTGTIVFAERRGSMTK